MVRENFYVLPYWSGFAGYVYAEVKNIGDKPVQFNGGLLELFDAEGNSIESENYRIDAQPSGGPLSAGKML